MIHENEYVCFCLAKRHPNVFMGRRLPSNCRYCNSPFDLNSVMSKADAQAKGMLKMPEESAPAPQSETPVSPTPPTQQMGFGAGRPAAPAQPMGFGAGRPTAPVQPTGFGAARPAAPAQPTGFGAGRPAAPAQPMGFGAGRPAVPAQSTDFGAARPTAPAQPAGFGAGNPPAQPMGFGAARPAAPAQPAGFGAGNPPAQPMGFGAARPAAPVQPTGFGAGFVSPFSAPTTPAANECFLDYFGEPISIPREGGWIGRSAIGSDWFKGNLLISREHVRVALMADGSLQVGPDKSYNGTSVTIGGAKRALDRNETVTLSPGDILWLYNVPLQLKRKEV